LIFVGSLTRHKGVHLILEALINFKDLSYFSELILVGDGEDRGEFEDLAKLISLPTQFLGHCSKSKVADLLGKSNVLLLPSKSEGFPKVVGEAMNFGCIPVVSDVSCIGDYIKSGFNGFLLEEVTSNALQTELQRLASWQKSDIRKALLQNSELASRFTYEYYNVQLVKNILNDEYL
jgi:glycosyltransferase involved in cell wall biosynthesis